MFFVGKFAWYDVKLNMHVEEILPKKNFQCEQEEFNSIIDLENIHKNYEACIFQSFEENWANRNKTCYPFLYENFDKM